MRDVVRAARQKVCQSDDVVSVTKKTVAHMRSQKPRGAGDQNSEACGLSMGERANPSVAIFAGLIEMVPVPRAADRRPAQ